MNYSAAQEPAKRRRSVANTYAPVPPKTLSCLICECHNNTATVLLEGYMHLKWIYLRRLDALWLNRFALSGPLHVVSFGLLPLFKWLFAMSNLLICLDVHGWKLYDIFYHDPLDLIYMKCEVNAYIKI